MNTVMSLPIVAALPIATPAMASSSRAELDALYAERTDLAARSRALTKQYEAAKASMPSWAQPGHEYLRGDGKWCGGVVGWPAINDDRKPAFSTGFLRKRPSPDDIRGDFESELRTWGEKRRPEIQAKYRRHMRNLAARIRRQREEEQKVGLPGLEARLDAIGDRISEINDQLTDLAVSSADTPQKAAAMLLVESNYDRHLDCCFGHSATLFALRPFLTGLIREHAEHAIANPDELISVMPWAA